MNPALNASPQPVVSTTSIWNAGTRSAPPAVTSTLPAAPHVIAQAADAALDQGTAGGPRPSSAPVSFIAWSVVRQEPVDLLQRRSDHVEQLGPAVGEHVGGRAHSVLAAEAEDLGRQLVHELGSAEMQRLGLLDQVPRNVVAREAPVRADHVQRRAVAVGTDRKHGGRRLHALLARQVGPSRLQDAAASSPARRPGHRCRSRPPTPSGHPALPA